MMLEMRDKCHSLDGDPMIEIEMSVKQDTEFCNVIITFSTNDVDDKHLFGVVIDKYKLKDMLKRIE